MKEENRLLSFIVREDSGIVYKGRDDGRCDVTGMRELCMDRVLIGSSTSVLPSKSDSLE